MDTGFVMVEGPLENCPPDPEEFMVVKEIINNHINPAIASRTNSDGFWQEQKPTVVVPMEAEWMMPKVRAALTRYCRQEWDVRFVKATHKDLWELHLAVPM